jgi:hypothetical protein
VKSILTEDDDNASIDPLPTVQILGAKDYKSWLGMAIEIDISSLINNLYFTSFHRYYLQIFKFLKGKLNNSDG